jgi:hypothetical protein
VACTKVGDLDAHRLVVNKAVVGLEITMYLWSCVFVNIHDQGEGERCVRANVKVRCTEDERDARVEAHTSLSLGACAPLALDKRVSSANNSVHNHV